MDDNPLNPSPLPIYNKWKQIPLTIATKTRIEERGLILAPDQKPVALLAYKKFCYQLYEVSAALPKPARAEKAAAPE